MSAHALFLILVEMAIVYYFLKKERMELDTNDDSYHLLNSFSLSSTYVIV